MLQRGSGHRAHGDGRGSGLSSPLHTGMPGCEVKQRSANNPTFQTASHPNREELRSSPPPPKGAFSASGWSQDRLRETRAEPGAGGITRRHDGREWGVERCLNAGDGAPLSQPRAWVPGHKHGCRRGNQAAPTQVVNRTQTVNGQLGGQRSREGTPFP